MSGADSPSRCSPHVLREYALVADGERGALIGPRGDLVWMCAPHWDSGAVFSGLIGGAGHYTITPSGRFVWGGYYEPGTLIWRSRWITESGIVECREALAFPGEPHRAVLLRRIVAVEGDARLTVALAPAAEFGQARLTDVDRDPFGNWTARSGALRLRWGGAGDARPHRDGWNIDLRLRDGCRHDLVLELSDTGLADQPVDPGATWAATETAWQHVAPDLPDTLAPADARHSAVVLRGLTARSGGMVAAATLGLPERARAGRNYDYRYVWIRDQCYAGQALAAAGPTAGPADQFDDLVSFVVARILDDGPDLAPAYTATGARIPDEHRLELPGYPGGAPVVGNRVTGQTQLDAFGEALLLLSAAVARGRADTDVHAAITITADAIAQRWTRPDAGLWELDDRHWAHSRLTCVAGLRQAATRAGTTRSADWIALADAILASTADCRHPSGRWQRAPDDSRVDAGLLLPALRGAVPTTDPRSIATARAVAEELGEEQFVYRFRHDDRPLGDAEGAFLLCGFFMALTAHRHGDSTAAIRWFERNRAACGPPGLFAEEYDIAQRQLRGNLPQAFVHALLLESAAVLTRPPR
ncbi:glycoside hydrolase family 15 protein [Pseudonocardia xinjiangensis]|uniref:glycoside hydrolase family 15 protein n=1 Tax=Pseudonocardia xinjiangensis TaxID=75289 RepID=UPI003D948597